MLTDAEIGIAVLAVLAVFDLVFAAWATDAYYGHLMPNGYGGWVVVDARGVLIVPHVVVVTAVTFAMMIAVVLWI